MFLHSTPIFRVFTICQVLSWVLGIPISGRTTRKKDRRAAMINEARVLMETLKAEVRKTWLTSSERRKIEEGKKWEEITKGKGDWEIICSWCGYLGLMKKNEMNQDDLWGGKDGSAQKQMKGQEMERKGTWPSEGNGMNMVATAVQMWKGQRSRSPGVKKRRVGEGLDAKRRRKLCPQKEGAYKERLDVEETEWRGCEWCRGDRRN